jgi:hypothetical protein
MRADESNQEVLSFSMREFGRSKAWRRRRYQAAFVSTLNDAEAGTAETQAHIEIAFRHHYLSQRVFEELDSGSNR